MLPTRDALIDAAGELLTGGGPAAVTLREVGRRAGVSHNAPYKHFADKEELLAAVAARDLERRAAATRRAARSRSPSAALRTMLHGYARHAARDPELFRLTYGSWQDGSAELGAAATAARSAFVDVVVAAQRDGSLPSGDPERLAALLLALVHGATDLALSGHLARRGKGNADPADLVDDLLAHLGAR
jgi:AcrR family transcriptional regulator